MLGFVRWKALAHFLQNRREIPNKQTIAIKDDPEMMDRFRKYWELFISYQGVRKNDSPAHQIFSSQIW